VWSVFLFIMENIENEIWKDIVESLGEYQISNFGRVKSVKRIVKRSHCVLPVQSKILKTSITNSGYEMVFLRFKGLKKGLYVHRLVAIHFIDNPKNKLDVNHINGIKTDNRLENLEWLTRLENMEHYKKHLKKW